MAEKSGDSESKDLVKIKLTCLHPEQLQQFFFGRSTELA
jgi:aspartate carbamoyltransferase regulatory subunit